MWGGYPAKKISTREELEMKFLDSNYRLFDTSYLGDISKVMVNEIIEEIDKNGRCYIE